MRARAAWGPVLLAAVAPAACLRESDPFDIHPDVVVVAALLIAGESEARLLAIHPQRPLHDAAPVITATLEGPGWTAEFSNGADLEACTGEPAADLGGPAICMRAVLPEPVLPGEAYGLRGSAPLGSFQGAMVVPDAPLLADPADSLLLPAPPDGGRVRVPIRYREAAGTGTLVAEIPDYRYTNDDGDEVRDDASSFGYPRELDGDLEADTLPVSHRGTAPRFSLRLLGIGWNYTNFIAHAGSFPLPRPWPSFGIEGEGVYGYFDGAAPSRTARILVAAPASGIRRFRNIPHTERNHQ